jgi:hypothetical protein
MGRPRFHPIRNTLATITVAGAVLLAVAAAPATAAPWQKAWGDYDSHQQWHDANWWMQNRHDWAIEHHPEWTETYAGTPGQIGDSDQLHVWHYGDGGFDRSNAAAMKAARNEAGKSRSPLATKRGASVKSARES